MTALVPLAVGAGGATGSICRVQAAETDQTPQSKGGFPPEIVRLSAVDLHIAGQYALDAARALPLPKQGWSRRLRRTLPRRPNVALAPVNTADTALSGLAPENSESAELGLALALLSVERSSPVENFVATGALGGVSAEGVAPDHGPVGAVGGIDSKISALREWIGEHKGSLRGSRLPFIMPRLTEDDRPILEAHAAAFERLKKVASKHDVDLALHPVESLDEAATVLGAVNARFDRGELFAWAKIGVRTAGIITLILLLGLSTRWLSTPTKLSFEAFDYALGEPLSSPLVIRLDANRAGRPMPRCTGPDGEIHVNRDDQIAIRVAAKDWGPTWTSGFFEGLLVIAGEDSSAEILTIDQIHEAGRPAIKGGGWAKSGDLIIESAHRVSVPSQQLRLIVLARKLHPYPIAELRGALDNIIESTPHGKRLNRIATYLSKLRGGFLQAPFRAVDDRNSCERLSP